MYLYVQSYYACGSVYLTMCEYGSLNWCVHSRSLSKQLEHIGTTSGGYGRGSAGEDI
jgi:hypothetical protein